MRPGLSWRARSRASTCGRRAGTRCLTITCIQPHHHLCRLQAPFGTADNPVVVPSIEPSRIVGVPDPDDDSLVWWAMIEEGDGPRQIIEGGEYFVLKRIPGGDSHHH